MEHMLRKCVPCFTPTKPAEGALGVFTGESGTRTEMTPIHALFFAVSWADEASTFTEGNNL
jgi:hypothetical protein